MSFSNLRNIYWPLLILLLAVSGCEKGTDSFVPPPPPEVTISLPVKHEVTDYLEFTGNTKAVESVEIRARVQGFLDKMNFQPLLHRQICPDHHPCRNRRLLYLCTKSPLCLLLLAFQHGNFRLSIHLYHR